MRQLHVSHHTGSNNSEVRTSASDEALFSLELNRSSCDLAAWRRERKRDREWCTSQLVAQVEERSVCEATQNHNCSKTHREIEAGEGVRLLGQDLHRGTFVHSDGTAAH
jgi:hypothetical protein